MIRIGTGDYCGTCGARAGSDAVAPPRATKSGAPVRRSMDIGPARRGTPQVSPRLARTFVVSGARSGKLISDVGPQPVAPAPARPASSAAALHARMTAKAVAPRQPAPAVPTMPIPEPSPYVEHRHASKLIPTKPTERQFNDKFRTERFEDRFDRAKQTGRSASVAKFSQHFQSTVVPRDKAKTAVSGARDTSSTGSTLSAAAATHHEALTKLISQMPPVNVPNANSRVGRVAAVIGAIVIMGAYVWLQNYPKMAIQAAGNKAGLSASLPGYVPSSFSLKQTSTQPGLVTLRFAAPNQSAGLTIAQHRTDWDSNSLLDNFVTKQGGDYAAVSGQGLTVYLFNQNQATWINHGVWYSITGSTRLSREQILKIAYSL